jgi:hypothetical protein
MGIPFSFGLSDSSRSAWAEMWVGLGELGELGKREAEIVADTGRRGIAQNFERERSPEGVPWLPLAKRTQEERKKGIDARGVPFRVAPSHPILVRTQDLKLSFVNPRHPRNITEVEREMGATFITLSAEDDPKTPNRIATLHAGGTVQSAQAQLALGPGWTTGLTPRGALVPARPFVGLAQDAVAQLSEQVVRVLHQRLERL